MSSSLQEVAADLDAVEDTLRVIQQNLPADVPVPPWLVPVLRALVQALRKALDALA